MAARILRQHPSATLNATALVNEVWLRLNGAATRKRGLGVVFRAMTYVLKNAAEAKLMQKRDAGAPLVMLDESSGKVAATAEETVLWCDAFEALEKEKPRAAAVARGCALGFGMAEIAEGLGRSLATVERDWEYARGWIDRWRRGEG
jgi:DNA-directed RNA polymerase specialized sigma24 family protein